MEILGIDVGGSGIKGAIVDTNKRGAHHRTISHSNT
jgi:sugar (pentulose or hexulose) kinase